jgi:predicted DsbA family dithiol-disulfide isomerase
VDSPFTIDVWSDVVCPFCYLGKRQLALALERFEHADAVRVRFRAFELDPRARDTYDQTLDELVARKYGLAPERASALHARLEGEAAALGMRWDLSRARPSNTFDAHRLIALGADQGRGAATVERLFAAYFCEGERVSDHATLARIGAELDLEGVDELLGGDGYADEVRADEADALELGITGVPAMVLDRRFMVSGAQPVGDLVAILARAWARREALR